MQDPAFFSLQRMSRLTRWVGWGVIAWAVVWSLASIIVIVNFGLRYPGFDQYHFYPNYLDPSLPGAFFGIENGHRPVLPVIVRIAEITWAGAGQTLQIAFGLLAVAITISLAGFSSWNDGRSFVARATTLLLAVLGVLWLGNARMLFHSNEVVAVYFVMAFALAALWAVHAAARKRPLLWMGVAGLCALGAAFSFGSGMAAFAAVFASAFVARVPWRAWILPLLLFSAAVGLYVAGMPGDSGVRNSLSFAPFDSLDVGLQWLSSPWMHAWLGFAEPSPFPDLTERGAGGVVGSGLRGSAGFVHNMLGVDANRIEARLIGGAGLVAWLGCLVHAWRSGISPSRGRVVAFGVATFALAVGATICLARLGHFRSSPGDVLAERYLPWSCLFWLGLALYALAAARKPSWRYDAVAAAMALALSLVLYPTQRWWAGWAAAVHRSNQASAVAAQMGLWDPQRFPDGPDASKADVLRSLGLLRERRLSMFGEVGFALWMSDWHPPATGLPPEADIQLRALSQFDDDSGRHVSRVEGVMPPEQSLVATSVLLITDAAGRLRGMAKPSFFDFDRGALRFDFPRYRGFDGYLVDVGPSETLSLMVVDPGSRAVLARYRVRF